MNACKYSMLVYMYVFVCVKVCQGVSREGERWGGGEKEAFRILPRSLDEVSRLLLFSFFPFFPFAVCACVYGMCMVCVWGMECMWYVCQKSLFPKERSRNGSWSSLHR